MQTNPPLPEWLHNQILSESEVYLRDKPYYIEGAVKYASLRQDAERRYADMRRALEKIAKYQDTPQACIAREALESLKEKGGDNNGE